MATPIRLNASRSWRKNIFSSSIGCSEVPHSLDSKGIDTEQLYCNTVNRQHFLVVMTLVPAIRAPQTCCSLYWMTWWKDIWHGGRIIYKVMLEGSESSSLCMRQGQLTCPSSPSLICLAGIYFKNFELQITVILLLRNLLCCERYHHSIFFFSRLLT